MLHQMKAASSHYFICVILTAFGMRGEPFPKALSCLFLYKLIPWWCHYPYTADEKSKILKVEVCRSHHNEVTTKIQT